MTTPTKIDDPTLQDLMGELIDVGSSLHMYDTIDEDWKPGDEPWIDVKYGFAKHAKEHLRAAIDMVRKLSEKEEAARYRQQVEVNQGGRDTW